MRRRYVIAGIVMLSMMRLCTSASSDSARATTLVLGIAGVSAALLLGRGRPSGGALERVQGEDKGADGGASDELLRGSVVRGSRLRSPGGTLVLTPRTLTFSHAKGEFVVPVAEITDVKKGRTLALFDNQLVLTLADDQREVFQIPDDRDHWLEAIRGMIPPRRSAYR